MRGSIFLFATKPRSPSYGVTSDCERVPRRLSGREAVICTIDSSEQNYCQVLICSLKGEVKKKHNSNGWIFSCFAAHLFEQDLF